MRNFLSVLILGALLVLPMTASFADEGGGPEKLTTCVGSHCVQIPADDGGGEAVNICIGSHCIPVPADDGGGF